MPLFLVIWLERQHFFESFNFLCCCHGFLCDYNCLQDAVVRRERNQGFFTVFTPQASFKIPLSRKTSFSCSFAYDASVQSHDRSSIEEGKERKQKSMQEFSYTLPLANTTFPGPVVRNREFLPDILLPGFMYSFVIGIKAGDINRGECVKVTTMWVAFSNFEFSPQFSCCYSFCTVLRKLPSMSRVFSCNHCIANIQLLFRYNHGERETVVGLLLLGQHCES